MDCTLAWESNARPSFQSLYTGTALIALLLGEPSTHTPGTPLLATALRKAKESSYKLLRKDVVIQEAKQQ